jgi:ABC-type lipoprotein release transport system permease subunit
MVVSALSMALAVGVGAGIVPAMRAMSLDPVESLHDE